MRDQLSLKCFKANLNLRSSNWKVRGFISSLYGLFRFSLHKVIVINFIVTMEGNSVNYRVESLRVGKSFSNKRPDLEKYASRLRELDQCVT